MKRAAVLVVTGPCATGKTTLVRQLVPRLGRPLLAKDDFKELLFDHLGVSDRDASRRLGVAAFELIWLMADRLVRAGSACIIEYPAHEGAYLGAGIQRLRADGAAVALLELSASPAAIVERVERRARDGTRHPLHHDHELIGELSRAVAPFGAGLGADRYRLVRTDDFAGLDPDEIAAWAGAT